MSAPEICVGPPTLDGRYVVFVQSESRQISDWCEPEFATWQGGHWHTWKSVFGWIGPIPAARHQQLLDAHFISGDQWLEKEYDL